MTEYREYSNKGTRKENQDASGIFTFDNNVATRNMDRGELFIVADGMGGHKAGREVARKSCKRLADAYFSPELKVDEIMYEDPEKIGAILKGIFADLNRELYVEGNSKHEYAGWGCTVSMLLLRQRRWFFCHSGDTRIYLLRQGIPPLLTEDQNIGYQMYKFGKKSYEEYLEGHGSSKLLSFMAQGEGISIQTGHGNLQEGDCFLLCSDGLNQFVEFKKMENLVDEIQKNIHALPGTTKNETLISS